MTDVFVIRNQLGHYWGKSKAWVDGSQPRLVLRTQHRDEAVNTLVELSSKDFELRGDVIEAPVGERGEPIIETSQIPLPIEPGAEDPADADLTAAGDTSQDEQEAPSDSPEPAEPVA
jgi:hypothetical protein